MNARLRAVGQGRGELDRLPLQRAHQFVADPDAQLGIEALTRHEHLGRGKPTKRIAPEEHAGALTFLQAQDAHGVLGQAGDIDLEQLVARIGVQYRLQRFGCMTVRHDTSAVHDLSGQPAHAGNLADGSRIGSRGVETQKARLAHQLTGSVEALDADVVKPGRPVHRGTRHRLGHQHQFIGLQQGHSAARQLCFQGLRGSAQNAQTGIRAGQQTDTGGVAPEIVITRTQESEVAVLQPVQEIDAFLQTVSGQR